MQEQKMAKQVRWGMIGCGAVTEVKSGPAYQQTTGFVLHGVTRRNSALAADYAKRHNIPLVFKTADELIASEEIDAVYIATPPDSHLLLALKVASAGKPCCIEKPLAPTLVQSEAILEAFTHVNTPLYVAYYRRSLPRFNKIKSLIDTGEIGQVRHVNWHLSKAASKQDQSDEYNWRTDKAVAPGGYFDDLASHGLDLFSYLFGDYQQVKGLATNQQNLYNAFDAITACWQHESGITGAGSWNFGGFSQCDVVTVYGSKGEISFSVFDEQAITLINECGQQKFNIDNPAHVQQYHVEHMAAALLENAQHPSTGRSATHTSWVMEQILNK